MLVVPPVDGAVHVIAIYVLDVVASFLCRLVGTPGADAAITAIVDDQSEFPAPFTALTRSL